MYYPQQGMGIWGGTPNGGPGAGFAGARPNGWQPIGMGLAPGSQPQVVPPSGANTGPINFNGVTPGVNGGFSAGGPVGVPPGGLPPWRAGQAGGPGMISQGGFGTAPTAAQGPQGGWQTGQPGGPGMISQGGFGTAPLASQGPQGTPMSSGVSPAFSAGNITGGVTSPQNPFSMLFGNVDRSY